MALNEDLGGALNQFTLWARARFGAANTNWNTNEEENFRRVLQRIDPEIVPEVLRRKTIPETWHCWWGSDSYNSEWSKPPGWVRAEYDRVGSCYAVVLWWAEVTGFDGGNSV